MSLRRLGLAPFCAVLLVVFHVPLPLAAQTFEVAAWLRACVDGVEDARIETDSDGGRFRLEYGGCLKTSRNACRFAAEPVQCFADHLETTRAIRQGVVDALPARVEGEGPRVDRMNRDLANARKEGEMMDVCLENTDRFLNELIHFPDELRDRRIACDHISAAFDFLFAFMYKRRLEKFLARD